MKILHFNSYFSANNFYKNLYTKQLLLGSEIVVFLPISKRFKTQFEYGEYVEICRCYGNVDRSLFFPKHLKILKRATEKYWNASYDIIHAHSLISNGFVAHGLSIKTGVPYIVAVRNTDLNFFLKRYRFLRPLARRILEDAVKIVFLSPGYQKETIETLFPLKKQPSIMMKSEIIPNGIDDFWLHDLANDRKVDFNNRNIQIVTVGQICRSKNITTVCKAVKLLQQKGYNISYTVIGKVIDDGILSEILTYPFVKYVDHVTKDKLIDYYRDSDVFVLPSITETFGLVYAEAMSQGLPIIYTKDQGFDGQFEEGHVGYHVNPKKPSDIAGKIKLVLENYKQLSSNCISSVGKFDWKHIAEQYESVYIDILKQASD
jgi:glycosyltransferase involved in cell wall biosynthesis